MGDYYKEQEENAKLMYEAQLRAMESSEYKITEEQARQILDTPPIELTDTPKQITAFSRMKEILAKARAENREMTEVSPMTLSPDDQADVDEKGDVFRQWYNEEKER